MEPQELHNSSGPGPEVVGRRGVAKERAAQRVHSWTRQNEMRSVVKPMIAGAAQRILTSANSSLI